MSDTRHEYEIACDRRDDPSLSVTERERAARRARVLGWKLAQAARKEREQEEPEAAQ